MSFNTKENYYLFIPLQFKAKRNRIQPYPKCTEKDTKLNRKDKQNRIEFMPLSITTLYDQCYCKQQYFLNDRLSVEEADNIKDPFPKPTHLRRLSDKFAGELKMPLSNVA